MNRELAPIIFETDAQSNSNQPAMFPRVRWPIQSAACALELRTRRIVRGVYPNVPNGTVSIANCLILWDFEIHELHSKRAIFSIR